MEHSNFFKVNLTAPNGTLGKEHPGSSAEETRANGAVTSNNEPPPARRNQTTSFLTATKLIYAIGAGITAAAGTRLALQWILVKGFRLFSFQLPDLKKPGIVIYCHYLPVSGLGNLRACCLPWMW